MSEILNNQYTDLFGFKQTKTFDGEDVVYYRLIGANLLFIHDKFDETVQVMDDELDSDEHSVVMHQSEFFESYAGYHMGTDDVTIEDLIRQEYILHIDIRSDVRSTVTSMEQLNEKFSPVSFKDIANLNLN